MATKKSWKQIENSRNNRLWITEVILPIVGMVTILQVSGFDIIGKTTSKVTQVFNKAKQKFNK